MADIVVVGAGTGGVPAAYELRHPLGSEHKITLVKRYVLKLLGIERLES